jgi:hypothetical protein
MQSVRYLKAVLTMIAAGVKDGLAIILVMTLFCAASCAKHWVHTTDSDQQWQADYEECQAQAGQAATAASYASTRNRVRQSALSSCLREKGWTPQD